MTRYWPVLAAAMLIAMSAMISARAATLGVDSIKAGNHNCPHCVLAGADLSNQCVKGGDLTGADFSGTKLVLACMSKSNFRGASFRSADLSGANLSESKLDGADLTGAIFSATQARGTDFSRAKGLTQAQLNGVCGDAKTRLPAGVTLPRCD
jgi:uncharacterized protein YjbI with pentapeptide repeats